MCLQTILQRLKNDYYTGYESLKADFDLIEDNSMTFNGNTHMVTESAIELNKILHSLITNEEYEVPVQAQPQSHSKKTQE